MKVNSLKGTASYDSIFKSKEHQLSSGPHNIFLKKNESDEIFLTGTAVEVTPVTKIDNEIISNGVIGNLTRKIQSKYQSIIVGNEKHYLDWLTFI